MPGAERSVMVAVEGEERERKVRHVAVVVCGDVSYSGYGSSGSGGSYYCPVVVIIIMMVIEKESSNDCDRGYDSDNNAGGNGRLGSGHE